MTLVPSHDSVALSVTKKGRTNICKLERSRDQELLTIPTDAEIVHQLCGTSNILTEIPHNSISTTDNVAYALQRGYNYLRAKLSAEDVFSQHERVSMENGPWCTAKRGVQTFNDSQKLIGIVNGRVVDFRIAARGVILNWRHFDKRTLEGQVVCEESIQPSFLSGLATVHCILLHIQSGGASLHLGVHLKRGTKKKIAI
ncbi:hypothetical protein F2P79_007410 [Pimephales promelas]|nr:hypothetical protein F2P79_007410 [Pimephales promelas]